MNHSNNLSRRRFIHSSLALGSAIPVATTLQAESPATGSSPGVNEFAEPGRTIPVNHDADVIVCGAGPAGVTAAISAARAGAKVRLFEAHGSLGGVWTSSLLGYLLDFDKPGFNQELVAKLRQRDAICGNGMNGLGYHPEEMKLLLEELCDSAGVKIQLHTRVAAAYRNGTRLTTIVTESKSGRQAWQAPVFIDTTGDGDLGAQAGCEFEIGEAKSCPCQPLSMCVLLTVNDPSQLEHVLHPTEKNSKKLMAAKLAFLNEIRKAGVEPSYTHPTLFPIRNNLLIAMVNHEYGILATDADAVSRATINARAELNRIVRALRKLGGPWKGVEIVATPEQIGIRDGRRILGRYVVDKQDLMDGARHDDAVVRAEFPVDIHAITKADKAVSNGGIQSKPYDIPLRALIAKDVDGLMMAGRCISGDFIAHASYRVTGNAVAMGEAAGATAALAATTKRMPHEVSWTDVKPLIAKIRNG